MNQTQDTARDRTAIVDLLSALLITDNPGQRADPGLLPQLGMQPKTAPDLPTHRSADPADA